MNETIITISGDYGNGETIEFGQCRLNFSDIIPEFPFVSKQKRPSGEELDIRLIRPTRS